MWNDKSDFGWRGGHCMKQGGGGTGVGEGLILCERGWWDNGKDLEFHVDNVLFFVQLGYIRLLIYLLIRVIYNIMKQLL